MGLDVRLVPLRTDNYAYLVKDDATGEVAVVDPSNSAGVVDAVSALGWRLDAVINTHHHDDHTGGNNELAAQYGIKVAGPKYDEARIAALSIPVGDGDHYELGSTSFDIIYTPGHTSGHVAFYAASANVVFTGDTLFSLGCGRLFEGTAAQMWHSLSRLRALPPETKIYCGHEYTQSNCKFALTIEPGNEKLQRRAAEIDRLRANRQPTIPTTVGQEQATNPFLRADEPSVQKALGMEGADPVAVFAELRRRKDRFS